MGKGIPWLAWFIIGLLVAAFSKVIDLSTDARGIVVFFYIGILFMLVGVVKFLGFRRSRAKQASQASQTGPRSDVPAHQPSFQHAPGTHTVVFCPHCHAKNYATFRFCHACGVRLR